MKITIESEALDTLKAMAEQDAKDAARYRWLVENAVIECDYFKNDGKDPASTKQPFDNAIDLAMQIK